MSNDDHSPTDNFSEPPDSPQQPHEEDDVPEPPAPTTPSLQLSQVLPPLPAPQPPQHVFDTRRVFVGRLVKGLAIDVLKRHFSAFGKLEKILLPEDAVTGKSKGYAFITFEDKASVARVLQQPQIIAGTEVDCKPALMKDSTNNKLQPIGTLFKTNKIFIGGLPSIVTASGLRSYFGQYGSISSCKVVMDKITGQSKGYGFCEYVEPSCVDRAMKHYDSHMLGGKWVQVKRAMPAAMREAFSQQLPTGVDLSQAALWGPPNQLGPSSSSGDGLLGPGGFHHYPPPPPPLDSASSASLDFSE
eukprot:Protomagalhaensia_wolfi_Nauph_80__920@NODE_152_length_3403_cov_117_267241_g113_i0_p2_GENE_NODE_152_length_3403_cov_117_267241_g113_i0NODE_152_length_3403_cov_117_267241_g113_i0_p2_ORF_typecomplete_len301_score46_41RRM_1/PF00076_22/4_7e13RRM_1/PF00076_22/3_7e18RRM_7/PF16367_5/1_2e07RRM_7/PF16367_5/3_8e06RRM_5/PF13893_6/0_18RRM_5/PF13893_6/0_00048Nup35_RRM_2/PF14605_6/0_0017Nup35_RRM_2/PF14605_6/90RL/PF17797_1/0_062RL/PF17797_1/9_1RRM_2/PF04059_12/0_08RRM_2/PF04059_12/16RRM_Rrp7/PF17799_1/2_6RRM_R